MARTIDADLLKQNCNITGGSSDNFVVVDLRTLGRVIDNQPTVDAVEVVHGEWKISSDGYYPYCSICNYRPKGGEMTKHCPDCGAKMDGGIGTAEDICKTTNIPCIKCNPGPCEHRKKG